MVFSFIKVALSLYFALYIINSEKERKYGI
jgi:hypothetical protein